MATEAVKDIQRALNKVLNTRLVVDGIIGPNTREALARYQHQMGFNATGILDPKTHNALKVALVSKPPTVTITQGTPQPAQSGGKIPGWVWAVVGLGLFLGLR